MSSLETREARTSYLVCAGLGLPFSCEACACVADGYFGRGEWCTHWPLEEMATPPPPSGHRNCRNVPERCDSVRLNAATVNRCRPLCQ